MKNVLGFIALFVIGVTISMHGMSIRTPAYWLVALCLFVFAITQSK